MVAAEATVVLAEEADAEADLDIDVIVVVVESLMMTRFGSVVSELLRARRTRAASSTSS